MSERPLRVLVATGIYPPDIGGPATHLAQVLPRFIAAGDTVQVVCFGDVASQDTEEGVRVTRISRALPAPVRLWRYGQALRAAAGEYELMYVHDMSLAGLAAYVVHRIAGIPYVLRLGGDYVWEAAFQNRATNLDYLAFQGNESGLYRLRRWLGTHIARGASAVIVPSHFLAQVVERWGVPTRRVHVVPNAIEESSVPMVHVDSLPGRMEATRANGARIVVASGRFVRRKHVETLIRAVAQTPAAQLFIIGSGPEEERYRELIAELGLEERVHIELSRSRAVLASVLAAADVFVLLDEGETFSFVTLEALRAGTPVVLTRAGALEEVFGAYEGRGVSFVERTPAAVASVLRAPLPPEPLAAVQEELRERYGLVRHVAAVRATMRGILDS